MKRIAVTSQQTVSSRLIRIDVIHYAARTRFTSVCNVALYRCSGRTSRRLGHTSRAWASSDAWVMNSRGMIVGDVVAEPVRQTSPTNCVAGRRRLSSMTLLRNGRGTVFFTQVMDELNSRCTLFRPLQRVRFWLSARDQGQRFQRSVARLWPNPSCYQRRSPFLGIQHLMQFINKQC